MHATRYRALLALPVSRNLQHILEYSISCLFALKHALNYRFSEP